ncbi:hypothetical protein UMZ34_17755 [Halopseudomonas pachastrellae]|nr:hypothetical protein UMZ34_17755 [Halopseudomonas pachastrellae]
MFQTDLDDYFANTYDGTLTAAQAVTSSATTVMWKLKALKPALVTALVSSILA